DGERARGACWLAALRLARFGIWDLEASRKAASQQVTPFQFQCASNTTFPPTTVAVTLASLISLAGMLRMSRSSTAMSASMPGRIMPQRDSENVATALATV